MPTRKAVVSKVASEGSPAKTGSKTRKAQRSRSVTRMAAETLGGGGRRGASGVDFTKLLAPGAAVLASGAIAAVGYAFKEQLAEIAVQALAASAKQGRRAAKAVDTTRDQAMDVAERLSDRISDKLSLESLLNLAGLQKRSTISAVLGPAIGVACGIVAGSALTYFLGPKLFEQMKNVASSVSTDRSEADHDDGHDEPAVTETADRVRANGGMHGGIS
jgi:hypothetical protein